MKTVYRKWAFLSFSILIWYWALVYSYTETCNISDPLVIVFLSPIFILFHSFIILFNKSKLNFKTQTTYLLSLIILFWITRATKKAIFGTSIQDAEMMGIICDYPENWLFASGNIDILYIPLVCFVAFTLIAVLLRYSWSK